MLYHRLHCQQEMPILTRLKQKKVVAFEPFVLLSGLHMGTQLALSLKIIIFWPSFRKNA